ncbi:MAG: serpin family protein [Alphaproteobacteria bacterium]
MKRLYFCLMAACISCLVPKFEAWAIPSKEKWEFIFTDPFDSKNKRHIGGVVLKFVEGGEETIDSETRKDIKKHPKFFFREPDDILRLQLGGLAAYLKSKDEKTQQNWLPIFQDIWKKAGLSEVPSNIQKPDEVLKQFESRDFSFKGLNGEGLLLKMFPYEIELVNNLLDAGLPFDVGSLSKAIPQSIPLKSVLDSLDNMADVGKQALGDILAQKSNWSLSSAVMEITGPLRLLAIMADSRFAGMDSLKSQMDAKKLLSADDIGNFFEHGKVETTTFALLTPGDLDRIQRGTPIPYVEHLEMLRCGKTDAEIFGVVNEKVNVATKGMIKSLDLSSGISEKRMALFTTAYFKDRWKFGPFESKEGVFTKADGTKINTDFIDAYGSLVYKKLANGDILALIPFKVGDWHYAIHMPAKTPESPENIPLFDSKHFEGVSSGLPKYEKDVVTDTLYSGSMESIEFPELDITSDYKNLRGIFSKQFPEMGGTFWGDAFIESMWQKVRVIVNPKGVEAAAVTSMDCFDCMPESTPVSLRVNRPYAMAIVEGVGERKGSEGFTYYPHFIGWVGDPSLKE